MNLHEEDSHKTLNYSLSAGTKAGLVIGGFIGLVIFVGLLLLPTVTTPRVAVDRMSSKNNLKVIAIGLFGYESDYSVFPLGGTFDVEAETNQHSWMTLMLPQLDENPLYRQIHFDEPWNSFDNKLHFQHQLLYYINPAIDQTKVNDYAAAHYSANSNLFGKNSKLKLDDITDGPANTILAGEVNSDFLAWGNPRNYRDPSSGINKGGNSFGSPFAGGANMIFADGHVEFISNDINPATLKALSTPNGGEVIGNY